MNISKYVTYKEATSSPTAIRNNIDNTPTKDILDNMKHVAVNLFDKVRDHFDNPLQVNSFYRCPALNTAIGGSKTSDHMRGFSIDVDGIYNTNTEIFHYVRLHCEFDQLIAEFKDGDHPAWIHMSLRKEGNRKQVLIAYHDENKKTIYAPYTDTLFVKIYGD